VARTEVDIEEPELPPALPPVIPLPPEEVVDETSEGVVGGADALPLPSPSAGTNNVEAAGSTAAATAVSATGASKESRYTGYSFAFNFLARVN
jgi:hypothetical protein